MMTSDNDVQVSTSGAHLVNSEEEEGSSSSCSSKESKKILYGLLLVFALAFAWVGAQQFAQSAINDFSAPYFTVWFSTSWMTLCFPAYCLLILFTKTRSVFWATLHDSKRIFAEQPVGTLELLAKIFGFTFLWVATNYCYVYSLIFIAPTDASAIISSNVAIVYLLSLLLLKERFFIIRIFAASLCISGVVLFAYADGYGTKSNVTGVVLALASAFGSAGYKVLFKRAIWQGTLGQVSLFLSILGVLNVITMWIVLVIFYFTGVESFTANQIPWEYLCGSSALSLLFNFLVNFGVAYTYPLFISIAMMLGVPLNALVDFLLRGITFSVTRLVAALLIICGFVLTMLPDSYNYPIHKLFCVRIPRCDTQDSVDDEIRSSAEYTAGEQIKEEDKRQITQKF